MFGNSNQLNISKIIDIITNISNTLNMGIFLPRELFFSSLIINKEKKLNPLGIMNFRNYFIQTMTFHLFISNE